MIGHFKVEQHKEAKSIIKHNENSIEENVTESHIHLHCNGKEPLQWKGTFPLQWKGIRQQFFLCY